MSSRARALLLAALACSGFISIGLPDGLHGVAWPATRAEFGLPIDALGTLLVVFTTGYLAASFNSGRILARWNVGMLLALSCLATAISLLGYALAPGWWMMVAFALPAGLGAGAIDAGLNTYAATRFSPRMVNWLHACYGIGTTSGPLLMTSVLETGRSWRWGYAIVGLGQMSLAVGYGLTHKRWDDSNTSASATEMMSDGPAPGYQTLRLPVVWLSLAVFFIYTGIEAAAGTWAYSLLTEARAVPLLTAGTWVSIYWGAFTVGRILSGLLISAASVQRMIRYCIVGLALGAALLWLNFSSLLNFGGLALMGLAAAPIFPALIATTPQRLGAAHTASGVGFQIAAAVLGQSLLPALIGLIAHRAGLEIIGPTLLLAALLLLALSEVLVTFSPKAAQPAVAH